MKQQLLFTVCLLAAFQFSFSQCMLIPLPLQERVANSQTMVEGKVLSKQSFWNKKHNRIYTVNQLEVFKIFKGNISVPVIEIVTEGGQVEYEAEQHTSTLSLNEGDFGIFTLNPVNYALENFTLQNAYDVFSSMQGFVRYDLDEMSARDVFYSYKNIAQELYPAIQQLTNRTFTEIKKLEIPRSDFSGRAAPVITAFSPDTISAGTRSKLTISGTGFGTVQDATHYVEFKNSDDSGKSYIKPITSEYILWNDTAIQVYVPSTAGTGKFRVRNGTFATAPVSLFIPYSNLNYTSGNVNYFFDLINQKNGGYEFRMNTDFDANSTAKEAFLRAAENWRCSTFVNWSFGSTTSVNSSGVNRDDINIIMFENPSELLPAGVLGRTSSFTSGCPPGGINNWWRDEIDMQFDNAANWNFSTDTSSGTQYDFESVVLHELGHAHQLGHVISDADIMNYSIDTAVTKRVLTDDEIAGGNTVLSRNIVASSCGISKMIKLNASNCGGLTDTNELTANEDKFIVYPNPVKEEVIIDINFTKAKSFSLDLVNMLGQRIFYFKQNQETQHHLLSLDFSALPNGFYAIKIYDGENILTKKIIIAK